MLSTTAGIETWGIKSKRSKLDIITQIAKETRIKTLDISNLSLSDLARILRVVKVHKHKKIVVPTGRLKKPYIESIHSVLPTVDNLSKLSVASLKSLMEALNNA